MAYACVRTDNMSGTIMGKDLVSAKYYVGETETAIENGNVVVVGGYLDGEREVRKATAPTAGSKLADCALVASPEVVKSKTRHNLDDFINEAGDPIRCYRLVEPKQIFSITKAAFVDGVTPAVGYTVELTEGTKFNAVETASGATVVGTVIAVEGEWYVIEVA